MALKILIADSDRPFARAAKKAMEAAGLIVEVVDNGKDAQVLISQTDLYALVISASIQNHTISQVLKFSKGKSIKHILAYANSPDDLKTLGMDEEHFRRLGVNQLFTTRPSLEVILGSIQGEQNIQEVMAAAPKRTTVSEEVEVQGEDDKFTSVRIDDFYSGKNVLFDVFIRLGQGKYLKILHNGDAFSKDRLERYKQEKKIEHLYISASDRKKYIQWNSFLLEKTAGTNLINVNTKLNIARTLTEKYMEEIDASGIKPQLVEQGKTICTSVFKMVEKEKDLYKILRTYQDMDPSSQSHCFMVALFSGMIVGHYDWCGQNTVETISMASLVHDIGKSSLPPELIKMPPSTMSESQLVLYKKHPIASVELLEGTRLFNNTIKQVVLQHHEFADGSGFPFNLRDTNISSLGKIISFVNYFVDIITEKKMTPVQGMIHILKDPLVFKRFNPHVLGNFTKVFTDPNKLSKANALPSNSTVVPTKKSS